MKNPILIIGTVLLYIFTNCTPPPPVAEIDVSNPLDVDRKDATIEISLDQLPKMLAAYSPNQLVIKDGNTNQPLVSQLIDLDEDGKEDIIIFQADIKAQEKRHFHVEGLSEGETALKPLKTTFARFVPERIDDFAWENDRVAFRTYGPTAQQITESGKPGGTLSSGIDCWLKKVDYPVIDKWYKQDLEEGLSYHEDHGEGLDNYHVGPSRGTGGIGVWKDGKLLTSKNYQSWKILANGPIRTTFELDYGTWDADGMPVSEKKLISIDLGSNLFKTTLLLGNADALPNITLGVTLHDKAGEVAEDTKNGWFRYLEPHHGSELSTALVVDPANIIEFVDHRVDEVDLSNMLVVCKPASEVSYYAGFFWQESGQFASAKEFDQYLAEFAQKITNPLEVKVFE